jgi:hypothetical protein
MQRGDRKSDKSKCIRSALIRSNASDQVAANGEAIIQSADDSVTPFMPRNSASVGGNRGWMSHLGNTALSTGFSAILRFRLVSMPF